MKVLLISMPDRHPYIAKREYEAPSLGIASIAGNLDRRHQVWLADLSVRKWGVRSAVRSYLRRYKPDIVGLSAMTFQYFTARRIARLIRQESPRTIVALGGYHATTMWRELAESPEAEVLDFIVRGEADHGFGELLDALEGRRAIESVAGLSYKKDGVYHHNEPRGLEDLSTIALPDRERRATRHYHFYFNKTDVVETSRGCLMRCSFCSMNQMYGASFRTYAIERVLADIDAMYKRGTRHGLILDDNITLDVPRLRDICEGLIDRKYRDLQFVIQASSAGIAKDPALPRLLADAGITMIFLGIENVSEENLMLMKKGRISDLTETAVRRLADVGIIVSAGLITGFAGDNAEDIRRNYQYVADMGVRTVLDQIITPYPGTEMRQRLVADGLVTNPYDFKWYCGYWAQVRTNHLTSKQLMYEKWKARREIIDEWHANEQFQQHYPRSSWVWNQILYPIIWANERRMVWMYGLKGRYKRQMMQWARLNDYFGDMVIDESFFDPDVEGPEGIGDPAAVLDFGSAPHKDRSGETAFVKRLPMRSGGDAPGAETRSPHAPAHLTENRPADERRATDG
jgi:anaerobic magnesium-protoporphyrin IX monomethyl ester cyclase